MSFLHNKKVIATSSCDSFSYVNPYLIQAETLPAKDIKEVQGQLISIIEEMAVDLNLSDGIFAFQYIRNGKDIQIIEMMRRPFGNQFLNLVELNSGFPWHHAQIVAETGGDWSFLDSIDKEPVQKYCGHFGIMVEKDGIVRSCTIPASIQKHVIRQFIMKNPGDRINDHLNERVSFLHLQYDSYDEMVNEVKDYKSLIVVEME